MQASSRGSTLRLAVPLALCLLIPLGPARSETAPSDPEGTQPGSCLSPKEVELARLIQQYRRSHGLPPVPLSRSLSLVAKWHAVDLETNAPNRKNELGESCGLHSWSEKGPWSALCYTPDHRELTALAGKPKELTGGKYRGTGFENVYFNAEGVRPFRVLDYWKVKEDESAILLEKGQWSGTRWPALGVGVYRRYAVIWFGTTEDPQGTIAACAPERPAR